MSWRSVCFNAESSSSSLISSWSSFEQTTWEFQQFSPCEMTFLNYFQNSSHVSSNQYLNFACVYAFWGSTYSSSVGRYSCIYRYCSASNLLGCRLFSQLNLWPIYCRFRYQPELIISSQIASPILTLRMEEVSLLETRQGLWQISQITD